MIFIRGLVGLLCGLTLFSGADLRAADRAVKFKLNETPITVSATKPFSLDMRTLLSDVGTGNLTWSAAAGKPAWLTVDSPNSLMKGTPQLSDVGVARFRLAVQDVEAGALTNVVLTVVVVPIWASDPLDLGIQNEDSPFQFDLKTKVTNPAGGAMTFTSTSGLPSWMTLTSDGILSGTPRRKDVGNYANVILVATTASGGASSVTAFGKVLKTIHPPKWIATPQTLADAFEDKPYSKELAPLVLNFEGAPLNFRLVSGPLSNWAKVSPSGVLSGTPGKIDIGPVVLKAEVASVIDGQTFTDVAEFRFNVIHTNHSPEWKQDPIVLPGGASGVAYVQSLSGSATDVDGDKLTFSLVSGPAWVTVAPDGTLSGTPAKTDVGLNTLTVAVSDGEFSPRTTIKITIVKSNEAPVIAGLPDIDMKERETRALDLKTFVTDPDGDALTFTLIDTKDWVQLTSAGALTLTPKFKDIGTFSLAFTVTDGKLTTSGVLKIKVNRNPRPPVWLEDPIKFTAAAGKPFSGTIAAKAQDLDGLALTFAKTSGPAWLSVSAAGLLSGTPALADLGDGTFKVNVRNDVLGVDATVIVTVFDPNQSPVWLQDPITLPNAPEKVAYSQGLAGFAKDPDGDALTFTKVSGPAWAAVASDGTFAGTPARTDVGLNTFKVRVTDPGGKFAEATVRVTVDFVNQAPRWKVSPLALADAFEDKTYSFGIAGFAEDPDGDSLTFKKISGPAWLTVSSAGALSGVPGKGDLGNYSAVFEVSDGKLTAQVTGNGKVIHTNHAPVAGVIPAITMKERETKALDLKTLVTDPDGDPLTFALVQTLDWTALATGNLTLTPKFKDIGQHAITVRVSDGSLSVDAVVNVTVVRDPRPPVWLEDPIRFEAAINTNFTANLKDKAKDQDGLALAFSKKSGPAWLTVAADGTISGKPVVADLGENTFAVTVKNDALGADATVIIRVFDPNHAPIWTQDPLALADAFEDKTYAFDLKPFAIDQDGDPLTFKKIDGPAWLFAGTDGKLTGVPAKADIGDFTAHFEVSDGKLSANVTARGKVIHVNHPPVVAPSAPLTMKERETKTLDLASFTSDLDGDALTFTLTSPPDWAKLSGSVVTLTPKFKDIGDHTLKFTVTDGALSVPGTAFVTVIRDPRPPVWLEDPIRFEAPIGKDFAASIKSKAQDLDGLALTFSKKSGPAWLAVAADGTLSGKPAPSDLGENTFAVSVKNDLLGTDATVIIRVFDPNQAPVIGAIPVVSVKEREVQTLDLKKFVTDADGDALTFTLIDGKDWIELSSTGVFTFSPKFKDIGEYEINFKVSDGKVTVDGKLAVKVLRDPRPPVWLEDPIRFEAALGKDFAANIKDKAKDLDGLALTFAKKSGPAWLTVAADGSLSGKPTELGDSTFVVTVKNDLLGADASVIIHVFDPNQAPVIGAIPAVSVKERETKAFDVKPFVTDAEGDALTFTLIDGKDWAQLSATGDFTFSPKFKDIGDHEITFKVSDGKLSANGKVLVKVVRDPRPPVWLEDPIKFEAAVNKDFAANIKDKAKDLDSLALTFSKKSGPAWLTVGADGALSGKPTDLGDSTFVVTVKNDLLGADATVIVHVFDPNHAPIWTQDPLPLADAFEDKTYAFDVKPFAIDQDGDALTFKKIDGPAWLFVATDGKLTGVPAKADVGEYVAHFEVSDGKLSAQVTARGKVLHVNHPPVIGQIDAVTMRERETKVVDLASFLSDSDGDTLTFKLTGTNDWVAINGSSVTLTPKFKDIGTHSIGFTVNDGAVTVAGTLPVTVVRDPRPPVWLEDPIRFTTKAKQLFTASLVGKAKDLDGLPLTFTKVSGPAWLNVSAEGSLSGTPQQSDAGDNTFAVTVKNDALGANATVIITVEKVNEPPVIDPAQLAFTIKEREVQTHELKLAVTDPDGDALTFTLKTGSDWATLASDGKLTLKPVFKDIGDHTFVFEVSDGQLPVPANFTVKVLRDPRPPVWLEDPIKFEAPIGKDFAANIKDKAKDLDSLPLTFAKKSGPAWLTIAADGSLSGKPTELGDATFLVTVKNDALGADATVIVHVFDPNHAPFWTQDPIPLPDALEDKTFAFDLKPLAVDPDGDALTFKKLDGPAWLFVGADGKLTGVPAKADLGDYVAHFEVSDGKLSANVTARGKVIHINHPPVVSPVPAVTMKERETKVVELASFASDLDGDALAFALSSAPEWAQMNDAGAITLTPKFKDIGAHTLAFTVSDGEQTVGGQVLVTVIRDPRPPVWLEDPIKFEAAINKDFAANIKDKAKDLDGIALTFAKKSGPAWLNVGADGALTGKPTEVGDSTFVVTVKNDLLGADATVIVHVFDPNHAPFWTQDPIPLTDALEDKTFAFDLKPFAIDPDGDALSFKKIDGPAWLFVATDGKLTGVPAKADLGDYVAHFEVSDGKLTAQVTARGKVIHINHPPVITPVPAITMKERETKVVAISASDSDGDALTFALTGGPDFAQLSSTGSLTLTPKFKDIGTHTLAFNVTDGEHTVAGQVSVTVVRDPRPPVWLEDPIRFQAAVGADFAANIKDKAKDLDGLALTFSKTSGPAWLTVAADGKLSGKPTISDLGENTFVVTVKNDVLGANASVIVTVFDPNHAPVIAAIPAVTVKERETKVVDLKGFVTDPDGDALTFTLVDTKDWIQLSSAGGLTLTPKFKDIGDYEIAFKVSDGKLSTDGKVTIKVIRDPRPPIWLEDPIRFQASIEVPFSQTVADKAKDQDGLPITFSKISGPAWMTVAADGKITGTPKAADLGDNTFVLEVKNDVLGSRATVIVTVTDPNHAPFWVQDPITLPNAPEKVFYTQTIAPFAKDPDTGDKLTFSKLSGPAWAAVTETGGFTGIPARTDVGLNTFKVRVTDAGGKFADATVLVTVDLVNHAPKWTLDPIPLGDIPVEKLFTFDLTPFANDVDGDKLTFKISDGPAWLQLVDGKLTGTPQKKDIGEFTATLTVSDGMAEAKAGAFGKVFNPINIPPVIATDKLFFIVRERGTLDTEISQFVTDPDGDTMKYALEPIPAWVQFNETGRLQAKPLHAQLGDHTFKLTVTDSRGAVSTSALFIRVIPDAQPPQWLENPIRFTAKVGIPFSASVGDKVKDPDNLPITISKASGNVWLQVGSAGQLSGIPALSDLGENQFLLEANNGTLGAFVAVIITVTNGQDQTDTTQVDTPVPGAPTENVWVVDNAAPVGCVDELAASLKANMAAYTNALTAAQVRHLGVFVATDAKKFDGVPIKSKTGDWLLRWDNANWITDFRYRVDMVAGKEGYNSPLWAMSRYYDRLPNISDLYHRGFSEPNIPSEVMVVTDQKDLYAKYAVGSAQATWKPTDYVKSFKTFHTHEKKSLRVNVLAPSCPSGPMVAEPAYQTLAKDTGGLMYPTSFPMKMDTVLKDYAAKVIFRAYVQAKRVLKLSKPPLSGSPIQLSIGGKIIAGNSGALDDKWFYDSSQNAVVIQWYLIDMATIKPGDKIEIRYKF